MYCAYCGAKLHDGANFCWKCGKKQNSNSSPKMTNRAAQWSLQEAEQKARNSYNALRNAPGYYCFGCGNYIDRSYKDIKCRFCGAEVIGADYIGNTLNNGLLSTLFETSAFSKGDVKSALSRITDYYGSEFYRKNQYPFEQIATDKGLMGEYLVDREYQVLKKSYPGRRFHVLYNLLVPEPNGSFEEVDAIIIYGYTLFVIEAKNRSGSFNINHLSDQRWIQTLGRNSQEITSPLMQNEWHIDALEHYLASKGIQNLSFINCVALAGGASFNITSNEDAYDDTVIRTWIICNTSRLCECIVDNIQNLDQILSLISKSTNETLEKQLQRQEETAQKVIAALAPQIKLNNAEKDLYKRDREETGYSRKRYPYQYFYVAPSGYNPSVIRWNQEYLQVTNNWDHTSWETDDNWHISSRGLPQYQNTSGTVYYLNTPLKIVRAVKCVKDLEPYEDDSNQYYQQEESSSHGSSNDQRNEREGSGLLFFAGCDTLDKLEKRYRILARAFHPDEGSGDEESFKKMQAEYEQLRKGFT